MYCFLCLRRGAFSLFYEMALNTTQVIFKHFRKPAKGGYYLCHVCLSVCLSCRLHGTTLLPKEGFFLKIDI